MPVHFPWFTFQFHCFFWYHFNPFPVRSFYTLLFPYFSLGIPFSFSFKSFHFLSFPVISYHFLSFLCISCHFISFHVIQLISFHFYAFHIRSLNLMAILLFPWISVHFCVMSVHFLKLSFVYCQLHCFSAHFFHVLSLPSICNRVHVVLSTFHFLHSSSVHFLSCLFISFHLMPNAFVFFNLHLFFRSDDWAI
jgi:hypothetical protein